MPRIEWIDLELRTKGVIHRASCFEWITSAPACQCSLVDLFLCSSTGMNHHIHSVFRFRIYEIFASASISTAMHVCNEQTWSGCHTTLLSALIWFSQPSRTRPIENSNIDRTISSSCISSRNKSIMHFFSLSRQSSSLRTRTKTDARYCSKRHDQKNQQRTHVFSGSCTS